MQKASAKKVALLLLRVALVVAPTAWIYARTDIGSIAATLSSASVPAIAAAVALLIVSMVLQGVKWWVLIHRFVPDLRVGRAVAVHIESSFYSLVLPTALAQDVVKSVMLSKSHDPAVVWAASWLGRLIGFFVLLSYSVIGIAYLGNEALPPGFRMSLFTAAGVVVLLGALSFSKRFTRPMGAVAARVIGPKIIAFAKKLRDGIYAFKRERATLAAAFSVSAVIQFVLVACTSVIVYAVSGRSFFMECLAFVPLVEIMAISLPLTPGGLGIREALMALLFTRFGFSESQIASYVTVSLLLTAVRLIGGVPALFGFFMKKARHSE